MDADQDRDGIRMSEPCANCGHEKRNHIYEDGPCRPGFVCPYECKKFVPVVEPPAQEEEACTCGWDWSGKHSPGCPAWKPTHQGVLQDTLSEIDRLSSANDAKVAELCSSVWPIAVRCTMPAGHDGPHDLEYAARQAGRSVEQERIDRELRALFDRMEQEGKDIGSAAGIRILDVVSGRAQTFPQIDVGAVMYQNLAMRFVLEKLLEWDHLDGAADGAFWRKQIRTALAAPSPPDEPEAPEFGHSADSLCEGVHKCTAAACGTCCYCQTELRPPCPTCQGTGKEPAMLAVNPPIPSDQPCPACKGSGRRGSS